MRILATTQQDAAIRSVGESRSKWQLSSMGRALRFPG
jgi:hypothetical protein